MRETEILENIRSTPERRKRVVQELVGDQVFYGKLRQYILKNSGSDDDARMVFHDAVIAVVKNVFKNHAFKFTGSVESYLMGAPKNLWNTQLRKRERQPQLSTIEDAHISADDQPLALEDMISTEKSELISSVLSKMRTRCKEVLMYWANGYKMTEIAGFLQYKSEGMARKKKSECMKELYGFLAKQPDLSAKLKAN